MTVVWHYVLPMLLGRTYDMRTDKPGVDVFPQSEIDNAAVIERHLTDAQYRIVEDGQEARDFLDVSGDLSLKVKAGRVKVEGLGKYLKETQSRANMVEILVKVHYETVTLTLTSSAKPTKGWKTLDKIDIGTHYVRSITYGGDMVASLKFTGKQSTDRMRIRAAVQANLQADTGSFGLGIAGNFSKLQEDLKDTSSLEINYYATVPIKGVANTMDALMELVDDFPAQTQQVNNGTGVPLRMELFPLTALDADIPQYLETRALVDQLDTLESQFDDIRGTKTALQEWLMKVPPLLPENLLQEIGLFNDKLEKISSVFYTVLGNLNFGADAGTEQFQPAFKAYEDVDGSLPDKYFRKFTLLKNKVVQETPGLSLDIGGTTYTHWGKDDCSSEGSIQLYKGVIVSTDRIKGGSSDIICLNENPQWDSDTSDIKRHPRYYSRLAHVHMRGRQGISNKPISCSKCLVKERTATQTFAAKTECPYSWTLEYKGYLMAKDYKSRKGNFLCVDSNSKVADKSLLIAAKSDRVEYIADIKTSCGTLPCEDYVKDSTLPCVVCSF